MTLDRPAGPQDSRPHRFLTTRWSIVLAAGGNTADAREALARLCQLYWFPLFACIRRWGHSPDEAKDLTQEFFARLLQRRDLASVDPSRGRFRSFLLASLKHFLLNEQDRERALKRGGRHTVIPLDGDTGREPLSVEPADADTPETVFERQWAVTLLNRVLARLRAEYVARGRAATIDVLQGFLTGQGTEATYGDAGRALGLSEGAVKVAVHRMRRRFGELLRAEIADTVLDAADIDAEIRYLFQVLGP